MHAIISAIWLFFALPWGWATAAASALFVVAVRSRLRRVGRTRRSQILAIAFGLAFPFVFCLLTVGVTFYILPFLGAGIDIYQPQTWNPSFAACSTIAAVVCALVLWKLFEDAEAAVAGLIATVAMLIAWAPVFMLPGWAVQSHWMEWYESLAPSLVWVAALIIALPMTVKQQPVNTCACGYPFRGLPANTQRCPECGEPILMAANPQVS